MLDVDTLYRAEYEPLVRFFRHRLGDDWPLAEDLVSDVFFRAWAKRDTYREQPGVPARAWLYRLAHNRLVDHWRTRRPTVPLDALAEAVSYTLRFEQIDRDIDGPSMDVQAAVDRLIPKQRDVIVGRFYEQRSPRDLAHLSTEAGVKKLQARALVNLRRMLAEAA